MGTVITFCPLIFWGGRRISLEPNYWDQFPIVIWGLWQFLTKRIIGTPLFNKYQCQRKEEKTHRNNGHKHHCLKRDRLQCRLLVPLLKYLQISTNKSLFFFLWKFSINTNLSIWHQRKSVIIVISPTIIYNMQPITW